MTTKMQGYSATDTNSKILIILILEGINKHTKITSQSSNFNLNFKKENLGKFSIGDFARK